MTRINCRNPECDHSRSATAFSKEGEHVADCVGCGDLGYTIPWEISDEEVALDGSRVKTSPSKGSGGTYKR